MADALKTTPLKTTPLNAAHRRLGARMVPFSGYDMPVQYDGVLAEHRWTREHAGLFDVSHMGQARITGADAAVQLERFVSNDFQTLKPGRQKYGLLLNDRGGILDDLMVGRPDDDGLFLVVNAGNKDADFALLGPGLQGDARLAVMDDRALLALQGPEAAQVLADHAPQVADMAFMDTAAMRLFDADCIVSRAGYTGEDGYEISVPADQAERIWDLLLSDARVRPIGLGARDSLRLEAGLPLHGHDIDADTTPVEAGLMFGLPKARRERADFPGAEAILKQLADGAPRARVALVVKEGAPAREGAEIAGPDGAVVGRVTSGAPSPSLGRNIALGFVPPALAAVGTELTVLVRGRPAAAEVVATPFVPTRYHRKPA